MRHHYYKIYPLDRDLSKLWFVEFKDPITGKRHKKYGNLKNCLTLKERLLEAERIVKEYSSNPPEQPGGDIRFAGVDIPSLIQRKLEEKSIYLRSKSFATYQSKVVVFARWYRFHGRTQEVKAMGLAMAFLKYLKELNKSNTTINAYRNTLKTLFKSLKKDIPVNPFEETPKLRERRKSYLYFDEEMQRYLHDIIIQEDPELWLACQCQYYLLLRPNELRTIKVGAFNLRSSNLRVEGDISKNSYTQSVMIPDEFSQQLSFVYNYPPHFYLFGAGGRPGITPHKKDYFSRKHQNLLKRHKINNVDYKFYSWKHTGAVMYYLATGDVKGLKEQGRWHSLDMVNEYLKNLGVMDIDRVKYNYPKIGSQIVRPGS